MNQTHHNFDQETKGWVDLIHPRESRPELTSKIDTKWLVIGAGFTGLSCARRLAEINPTEKIVLLEAREIGQSASGRNRVGGELEVRRGRGNHESRRR